MNPASPSTMNSKGDGGCRMKAKVGYRVFTIPTFSNKRIKEFISEFRSRCMAYCFSRDNRLLYPKTKFVYVDVLATQIRHNLSKSRSIRKSVNINPLLPLKIRHEVGAYGNRGAIAILDLVRMELRIPFLGVKVRIRDNLRRKIIQMLSDDVKPRFTLQLKITRDGVGREVLKLNIIVQRYKKPTEGSKKLILAYDVNSRYGVTLVALRVDEEVKLMLLKRYRPPNHCRRRKMAAVLQREGRDGEAARVRRKEKKLNREFIKDVIKEARKMGVQYRKKGYEIVILVDKPDYESLNGTLNSGTLNRLANALRNLCLFEGFKYIEMRVSGKYCPICGEKYVKQVKTNGKRIYACKNSHIYERDFTACWNLILRYVNDKKEKIKELLLKLGARALGAPSALRLAPQP